MTMSDLTECVRTYSDKEIAVFEAVAQLMNQGRELYNLRVAEIAAAANIGKGTAYEYFASKTELLRKAFHYHIINEYKQISALANRSGMFQQTFRDLLEYSGEMMHSRMPNLWAMLSTLDPEDIKAMSEDKHFSLTRIMSQLDDLIEQILQLGVSEGLISADTSRSYRHFALTGAVSAYIHAAHRLECPGLQPIKADNAGTAADLRQQAKIDQDKEALMADAWNMLLKALN